MSDAKVSAKVIPINAAALEASEKDIQEWFATVDEDDDSGGFELLVVHQGNLIRELRRDLDDLRDRFIMANGWGNRGRP